jgi:hypothetical protein
MGSIAENKAPESDEGGDPKTRELEVDSNPEQH